MNSPTLPTSRLRLGLCAKIVRTVMASDSAAKLWLADRLEAHPFVEMTDTALIQMCKRVAGVEETAKLVASLDTMPIDNEPRYHCRYCRDLFVVSTSDGRWFRCQNCNPGIVADEPAAPPHPATQSAAAQEEF